MFSEHILRLIVAVESSMSKTDLNGIWILMVSVPPLFLPALLKEKRG